VARALDVAGTLAWSQGDIATARPLFEESIAIGRELADEGLLGYALTHLGLALLAQGEPPAARAHFQEGVEHFRAAQDDWGIAFSLVWLAGAFMTAGNFAQARTLHEESLVRARNVGDPWLLASALDGLADLNLAQGDAAAAQTLYEEANTLFRQVGDRFALAWGVCSLGFAVLHQGDSQQAPPLFAEALALGQELDNPTLTILYLSGMAGTAVLAGQGQSPAQQQASRLRAARLFGAAKRLHRELQVVMWQGFRRTHDQLLANAHTGVDATDWDAAFAEGQAMTRDQALAYASATGSAASSAEPVAAETETGA
jgi:tetratricopeptide (TPR) repeat protein